MKTAHQFARELLALPDLPVFHFDPSRAGINEEGDTGTTVPTATVVEADGESVLKSFITIDGEEGEEPTHIPNVVVICRGQADEVISLRRVAPNQFQARPMSQDDDFGLKVCPGDILEIT